MEKRDRKRTEEDTVRTSWINASRSCASLRLLFLLAFPGLRTAHFSLELMPACLWID